MSDSEDESRDRKLKLGIKIYCTSFLVYLKYKIA